MMLNLSISSLSDYTLKTTLTSFNLRTIPSIPLSVAVLSCALFYGVCVGSVAL
jgi:hypothetical protein